MAYEIEGRLLEVCTCNVLCPCWVGEDPDYKTCDTVIAWGIEKGSIEGVDVDGLTMAVSAHIPKNILIPKSWKAVVFVDERASAEQEGALLQLFTGQLGGAIADLAGLIGEVVAVERAPITLHRRRRQGPAHDRDARRGRDGAVHGRDRQADHAGRDRLQHHPGLARLSRARRASSRRTAARTGSRASTSRATTPCRATSASRPDGATQRSRTDVRSRPPPRPAARPGDPDRVARRARGRGLARAVAAGRGRRTGTTSTTTADGGPRCRSRPALFAVGWVADDRRDDAAHRACRWWSRSGRSSAGADSPAGSSCCCSLGYLAGLGRRSGSPPGSATAASTPRSMPSRGSPSIPS